MKQYLFLFVALLTCSSIMAQQTSRYAVYFETGRHELSAESRQTLDQVLQALQYPEDYSVDILAHTDDRGSDAYNLKLAERRALSVKTYLAGKGLKTEKTATTSLGESDPAYANDDESSRKFNRRVDLVVNVATLQSLSELTDRLGNHHMQYFTINPEKSVQLTGRQGTNLWIEAGSFQFADGSGAPTGSIEFALRETYDMSDMLLADLSTTCGDKLLETAGMIYVDATSNGRPLQLKSDAQIVVSMPAESLRPGMELFLGEQNAEGRLTNWQATGQAYQTSLEASLKFPPVPKMPNQKKYRLPLFTRDESAMPQRPVAPREVQKPSAPKREHVKYRPGFMDRMVMGKEKIREKEEEMFQKKVADYEKNLAFYESKQYPDYVEAMKKYEADEASYPQRMGSWLKMVAQQEKAFYESDAYKAATEKYAAEWKAIEAVWRKSLEAWQAEKQARLEAFEAQSANAKMSARSLDNYFYQVNRLGWVNCDIYSNTPGERMRLAIRDEDNTEERIFVILKDRKSLLGVNKSTPNASMYLSAGIPVSTPVRILAIKLQNGYPMMAVKETRAGDEQEYRLEYKRCSPKEIRLALEQLNG